MAGDPSGKEVFDKLVREHRVRLLVFVGAVVHNPASAEDICQNALATSWQRFAQFDPDRSLFGTWLWAIAKYKIVDFIRSNEAYRKHVDRLTPEIINAIESKCHQLVGDPGDNVEWRERLQFLRECVSNLQDRERSLISRYYFEGHSSQTLADQYSRSVDAIRKGLQRARLAEHRSNSRVLCHFLTYPYRSLPQVPDSATLQSEGPLKHLQSPPE